MDNHSTRLIEKRLGFIAIAAFSVFPIIIILMHFIHPEFSFSKRFMSEYVLGEFGWLLNFAFIGNLIGSVALIIAIFISYPPPFRPWISLICYGIATITIITNFFPTDIHGKAVTVAGLIHNIGSFVGSIAGLLFMIAFSIRLKKMGLLKGHYRILILLAVIAPIFFLTMLIIFDQFPGSFVGAVQRIYVLIMLVWIILTMNGIRTGVLTPQS